MHAIHLKFFYKNIIIHLKAILKVDKYEKVIFYRSPALFALFQVMHSVMILKFFFFTKILGFVVLVTIFQIGRGQVITVFYYIFITITKIIGFIVRLARYQVGRGVVNTIV